MKTTFNILGLILRLSPAARLSIAGLFLVATGLWMIYPPAAFIAVGAALIVEAVTTNHVAALPPEPSQPKE